MKANDSLKCRNCHASVAMDLQKQTQRAAIAHELPNMDGVDPGWKMPKEFEGEKMAGRSPIDDLQDAVANAHYLSAHGAE